jgi:hypothetical protein
MLRLQALLSIFVAFIAIQCTAPCSAQTKPEIEAARLKGMDYIKSEQYDDGSWEFEGHDVGITSLCAMALIENGMPVSDPVIDKAHRYVQKEMADEKSTYDIALGILFLSRVGDRDNRSKIRDLAARLVAGQNEEGGWGYACPLVTAGILSNPDTKPKLQAGVGDNSCTQFAVLGLWVASRWGVDIGDTMSLVGSRFIETQREDGGWPYRCEEWTKLVAEAGSESTKPGTEGTDDPDGPPKKKKKKEKPVPAVPGADPAVAVPGDAAGGGTGETKYEPSSPSMTFAGLFCLPSPVRQSSGTSKTRPVSPPNREQHPPPRGKGTR